MKAYLFAFFALAISLSFSISANDATSSTPPSVTMGSAGGPPTPPVCNASTQVLRWTGTAWQCIAPPTAVLGKGAITKIFNTASSYHSSYCPAGSTGRFVASWRDTSGYETDTAHTYICVKN